MPSHKFNYVKGTYMPYPSSIGFNGGGGSGSDIISTLTDGQMAQYDSGTDSLIYAHMTVDEINQKIVSDYALEVPQGTLDLSDTLSVSEATLALFIRDNVLEQNFIGIQASIDETGTGLPGMQEAPSIITVVAQPDDGTVITTNPLSVPIVASFDNETDTILFRANGAMSNVRMTLTDNTTGIVLKYLPSKAAITNGIGGMEFVAGDNLINMASKDTDTAGVFNVGFTPLRLRTGEASTVLIEADNMDLLGNGSDTPYLENVIHPLFTTTIPRKFDTSNIADPYIRLNNEYTVASGTPVGIVSNYLADGAADTVTAGQFTAGVAATSNPTVITDGSATFAQGDFVQFKNSVLNSGLYEVEDHTGTLLTVRGVGTVALVDGLGRDDFFATVSDATITKMNVSVLRSATNGNWEEGKGSETPIVFHELGTDTDINIYNQDGIISENRTVEVNDAKTLEINAYDSDSGSFNFRGQLSVQDEKVKIEIFDDANGLQTILDVQQTTAEISAKDLMSFSEQTLKLHNTGAEAVFTDTALNRGLTYPDGHGYTFDDNTLVDKSYVDGATIYETDGTLTGNRTVDIGAANTLLFESVDAGSSETSLFLNSSTVAFEYKALPSGLVNTFALTAIGAIYDDTRNTGGIKYAGDYSDDFSPTSLIDKNYSDFESLLAQNVQVSGLTGGGVISVASATTLDVTAGEGYIADFSDPTDPDTSKVSWAAELGYAPANLAIDGTYVITFDDAGTIGEIPVSTLTNQNIRDNIIVGTYTTQSSTVIAIDTAPLNLGFNGTFTAKDFIRDVIGPANVNGNVIGFNGANLAIDNTGGTIFVTGANFRNSPEVPDEPVIPTASPMTYLRVLRGAGGDIITDGAGTVAVLDNEFYDDGSGTLVAMSSNDFSVQVVYIAPGGGYIVAYGQEVFNTQTAAELAISNGSIMYEEQPTLQRLVRRCFLVVKEGITDLSNTSNATFVTDGNFRGGSASTSSGIPGINTPGGSDNDIQFNNAGAFGGTSSLTWDHLNEVFSVNGMTIDRDSDSNYYLTDNAIPALLGTDNIAIGDGVMANTLATSDTNIGIGSNALAAVTEGRSNVGIGELALNDLTTGLGNTAIGFSALSSITTTSDNLAIGTVALLNATGSRNIALSHETLDSLVAGDDNLAIGHSAGNILTTGSGNTLIGTDVEVPAAATSNYLSIRDTIFADTLGKFVAIGGSAVKPTTDTLTVEGNTAINGLINGLSLDRDVDSNIYITDGGLPAIGDIGENNLAIGLGALDAVSGNIAARNVALGNNALTALTTGSNNIAIGHDTLAASLTGSGNFAFGDAALSSHTAGVDNSAFGRQALQDLTTGNNNVALGPQAALVATDVFASIFIGCGTANALDEGTNLLIIGDTQNVPAAATSDFMNIGGLLYGDLSGQHLVIGGSLAMPTGTDTLTVEGDATITGSINEITAEGNLSDASLYIGDGLPSNTGTQNTVIGYGSGVTDNIAANENTILGENVAPNLPTATSDRNTLLGSNILTGLTLGTDRNTIIGANNAMANIENCSFNVMVGDTNCAAATNLEDCAIIGRDSLKNATNHTRVVSLGNDVGNQCTGALTDVLLIGHSVDSPIATTDNYMNIANLIQADTENKYLAIGDAIGKPAGPCVASIYGDTYVEGNFGLGTNTPDRQFHMQGSNAVMRIDRDSNSTAVQMYRTASGDFDTIWKGFQFGVTADGVNDGEFSISDRGTSTSGSSDPRLIVRNDGEVNIPETLSTSTKLAIDTTIGEPATPSNGAVLYIDTADFDLKVKFDNGTVVTLASG